MNDTICFENDALDVRKKNIYRRHFTCTQPFLKMQTDQLYHFFRYVIDKETVIILVFTFTTKKGETASGIHYPFIKKLLCVLLPLLIFIVTCHHECHNIHRQLARSHFQIFFRRRAFTITVLIDFNYQQLSLSSMQKQISSFLSPILVSKQIELQFCLVIHPCDSLRHFSNYKKGIYGALYDAITTDLQHLSI